LHFLKEPMNDLANVLLFGSFYFAIFIVAFLLMGTFLFLWYAGVKEARDDKKAQLAEEKLKTAGPDLNETSAS